MVCVRARPYTSAGWDLQGCTLVVIGNCICNVTILGLTNSQKAWKCTI